MAEKSIKELAQEIGAEARRVQAEADENLARKAKERDDAKRLAAARETAAAKLIQEAYAALGEARDALKAQGLEPTIGYGDAATGHFSIGGNGYEWAVFLAVTLPTSDGKGARWQLGFARAIIDEHDKTGAPSATLHGEVFACTGKCAPKTFGKVDPVEAKEGWSLARVKDMMLSMPRSSVT